MDRKEIYFWMMSKFIYRIYYILYEKRKALNTKIETLHMHKCAYCRLGFVLASLI